MEEDTEYMKLPIEDRCVHKLWKARLSGYEEAGKLFQRIDDEKSPEWSKYLGLVKKFVVDSNAVAQEKGLEATLAFVENCGNAGKTVGEVVSGIIGKCIAAPKTKTRELSLQIILMYVEIEKFEAVQEELVKGMDHKNPKIVSACVAAITQALREFGPKVISIKPLVKKMPALLEDRDKTVREEGKAMVIEMHRWIGAALKPQLTSLKPVQVTELEAEFEKAKNDKAVPTRYLRSQQAKQAKQAAEAAAAGDGVEDGAEDDTDAVEIDPYELMAPVDILSKLPAGFYDKVEAKKWQERKEVVEAVESLLQSAPKLESGDYGDLVRALKKIISKDTNVMVVAVAGKCLAGLANGLKKRFQPYAGACIPALLEKFREKKTNVVAALREATDAVYLSTTLENIQEDVLAALDNKNPSVKSETAAFLARCFCKCTPAILNKKLLKVYSAALIKAVNEPDPSVRDNASEALGTALKVVGEKALMPFVADVDNLKMAKIRECCEKAVITAKPTKAAPSERPSTAPPKSARSTESSPPRAGSTAPKPVKRPATSAGPTKKPGSSTAAAKKTSAAVKGAKETKVVTEKDLSEEEVEEKASSILSSDLINGLSDSVWKTRLSSVEEFSQVVRGLDDADANTQVLLRTLNRKPGLKDTNFQVLKARLEAVKLIAENYRVSTTAAAYVLNDVAEKLGDAKNGGIAAEALTALAEATKLDFVATEVIDFAINNQKSPKVQQEALNWMAQALIEFGFVVQPKALIENVRKGVGAVNPGVRTAAIQLLGKLYLYMGPQISLFFENEKPALLQQINAEFEKHAGEKPPAPIRGLSKAVDAGVGDEDDESEPGMPEINVQDLVPRVDLGPQITEAFLSELGDKNWKVRNEALQKLSNMLSEARFITGNLGELPPVLAPRLVDSNAKIAASAVTICQTLATAMGTACKQHTRTFFPNLLLCMGDSKAWIRSSAIACINTYGEQGSFKEFFEGEVIADSLKSGTPALRVELWNWLAEKLPTLKGISKDELVACLPHLYSNLEDRNADVRKNAQEATLGIMIHVGYEGMLKATSSLKPGSRNVVVQHLDKVRANLPAKPAPAKSRIAASASDDQLATKASSKAAKATPSNMKAPAAGSGSKTLTKPKPGSANKTSTRKKEEDVDTSPLLQVNNMKNQRSIDEQKLKVLKWNFMTPREEFVELLRDQMTAACFNRNLIANMFHADFKFHLKAIEMLVEDLPENGKALTCNLDLILKWMTLRFFDTNPSVLLKGLEYLQTVYNMLIDENYSMLETEASSFIPYLILKVGDPKDAVRHSVRALFKQIGQVYPVSKLFSYIMEGLKSKNARQRTECLEELGSLIENYGISVCQPSPAAALKEVAKQISDRDNAVRNAALNCVVQAYYLEGEKVYKMVGHISDKDMSLLEERIKRAAKNRPPPKATPPPPVRPSIAPPSPQQAAPAQMNHTPPRMQREASNDNLDAYDEGEEMEHNQIALSGAATPSKPRPASGPFGLDMEFIEKIENEKPTYKNPNLIQIDLSCLNDAKSSDINKLTENYNSENKSRVMNVKNSQQSPSLVLPEVLKDLNLSRVTQPQPRDPVEELLDCTMSYIAGSDVIKCRDTLTQVDYLIRSDKVGYMVPKVDQFITSCVAQLRTLVLCNTVYSKEEQALVLRALFSALHSFYTQPTLSRLVSMTDLKGTILVMVRMLAERRLEGLSDSDNFVQLVNILVMVIIDKSEHTRITCALLKLLHESVEKGDQWPAKMQELFMKCIWKVVRCFPSWEPDFDYDSIMYEIHVFLKAYPTRMWKQSQSDVPLRTVKTLLHAMVKQRGSRVLQHMSRINEPAESELTVYINKFLKNVKQDDSKVKDEKRLSKDTHEVLAEIFKKIGSKDQTKEGLRLLYEFKEEHGDASIEPFLGKSSQFFQDYIQRGLQTIELSRRRQNALGATAPVRPAVTTLTNNSTNVVVGNLEGNTEEKKDAQYYMERLRALQMKAGFEPTSSNASKDKAKEPLFSLDSQLGLDQNLNFNSNTDTNTQLSGVLENHSDNAVHNELSNREALRRRLEEVKGSSSALSNQAS